ncbi:MAG: phospholipase D family protein [Pseudolysinimonas sp.]
MTLIIQDPSRDGGPILVDELLDGFGDPRYSLWRGLYAFASAQGAVATLEDPAFTDFLARGGVAELVVGIDAVTNPAALIRLREHESAQVKVEVFTSARAGSIFHPKVSIFSGEASTRLIIGSGNFTVGGLRRNYEAFATVEESDVETIAQWNSEWHHFRAHNIDRIGPIDDEVIERARRNERIAKAARRAAREEAESADVVVVENDDDVLIAQDRQNLGDDRRTLVAQVPVARWGQVQFDQGTAESYFGLKPGSTFAITLQGVDEFGDLQSPEARRLVFSGANGNAKIEFSTRRDQLPPPITQGRPILVVREDAPRTFVYSLFMPGDTEYTALNHWIAGHPTSRGGMRRPQLAWADFVEDLPDVAARISDATE